ncbi:MAG TPA: DNA polymerase IV, partial [Polyangiaceae bacterium]|nr:DNA polymerase IV [Polyangiaceae bacterium]
MSVSGERQILHVDMDAFYASVEQHDNPLLRGRPVVVGARSARGVVTAASYEARPFGVRSAMSMAQAMRLCPHAEVVPPRMERYAEVSEIVFGVLRNYTPLVEGLSLDEAFLDVTKSQALFGDGEAIARQIKADVFARTGLRASAGVAPCKFVAKIASDLQKPDGLVVVRASEVTAFLGPLPIERMWGIGQKSAPKLHAMGLHTLADIAEADARHLEDALGTWGIEAQALARGIDPRNVFPDRPAKSIGAEETFERDLVGPEPLLRHLLAQTGRVARRLCREHLLARVVVVKLKFSDFTIQSRRVTVREPVGDTDSIFAVARTLLDRFDLEKPVRLTGVSVSDLCTESSRAT